MTLMPTRCDLGYPHAEPCGKPVQFYALSADSPMLWSDSAGASLGGYCCLEHANAEPRPTLDTAKRTYGAVMEGIGCSCGHCQLDGVDEVWRQLIDNYPDPVPANASTLSLALKAKAATASRLCCSCAPKMQAAPRWHSASSPI